MNKIYFPKINYSIVVELPQEMRAIVAFPMDPFVSPGGDWHITVNAHKPSSHLHGL